MKFNYQLFAIKINEKMFSLIAQDKKKYGLRHFADLIGISSATLSRILNQKSADLNTILTILNWLDLPLEEFIIEKTIKINLEINDGLVKTSFEE